MPHTGPTHSTLAQAAFEGFPGQEAERVPLTVKDALGKDMVPAF